MIYIGIDPSICNTGVVVSNGEDVDWFKIEWKNDEFQTKNNTGLIDRGWGEKTKGEELRLSGLRFAVSSLLGGDLMCLSPGDRLAIERPMGANITSAYLMGMAYATILSVVCDYIDPTNILVYTPPELKKFATGKGNAKKDLILQQVYKRWGVEFDDHNLADAFVLAKMAEADYNKLTNNP